jgi:predicted secreted acid phosphatase
MSKQDNVIKVNITIKNKALRKYFPQWLDFHTSHLKLIKQQLSSWKDISQTQESYSQDPRPLSIVFDLDEVLITPISHNFYKTENETFVISDFFEKKQFLWPSFCPAYPEARELVKACKDLGLNVFFITARLTSEREHTLTNLNYLDLIPDHLFTMPVGKNAADWKRETRKEITNNYRIIANIGDQLTDLGDYADINYLIPHHFYTVKY